MIVNVELDMQEEVIQTKQRMANQISQRGGTLKQPTALLTSPPPQVTQASSLTQLRNEGDEEEIICTKKFVVCMVKK